MTVVNGTHGEVGSGGTGGVPCAVTPSRRGSGVHRNGRPQCADIGAGASVMAWWRALAFDGQTMRGSDSPEVFVLLTFSVMFFVAADLAGATLLWHLKRRERTIMRTRAAVAGLIIVYGAASTTTLALIAASEWALGAILPGAFTSYVLYSIIREWRGYRVRRDRRDSAHAGES